MKERLKLVHGEIHIDTKLGGGTVVYAMVPLDHGLVREAGFGVDFREFEKAGNDSRVA
jgi:hypothetical protein